ncbi:hypothetical protein FRB90_008748 [Tulasnella sp. 427]|nr:hypothetical protein FRB90_008748 [Tulasnella sp. 427]
MPRITGPSPSSNTPSPAKPTQKTTYHVPFFGPPALKNPIRLQKSYEYDDNEKEDDDDDDEQPKKKGKGKAKQPKRAISSATQERLANMESMIHYWNRDDLKDFMKGLAYRGDKGAVLKTVRKGIIGHLERHAKRGCRLIEEETGMTGGGDK